VITEAVCEPSYCKDLLAAFFGLLALLPAMRHNPGTGHGDILRMFLCPLLCLLAIGSKEVGVAIPAVLFLYWILFRRTEPGRFWAWIISSSVAVIVIFLFARFSLAHHPSEIFLGQPEYPGGSLSAALLIQPRILTFYLINLLWPFYLCADYNGYTVKFLPLSVSLFVLMPVLILIGAWAMKDRRVLFGAGFIVLCLLPVCNLVPIYHPMADRYLYLPMIGIAMLVAVGLESVRPATKKHRWITAACFALPVFGFLIPFTLQREKVWSNDLVLWQDTLDRNPASLPARINLPEALLKAGRPTEAKQQSEATLRTPYATEPWAWADYALELNRLGDTTGAALAARRAIELKPDIIDAAKMIRTLQCSKDIAFEFAQLAASLPDHSRERAPDQSAPDK